MIAAPPAGQFGSPAASWCTVGLTPFVPFVPFDPGVPAGPCLLNVISVSSADRQCCLSGSMILIVPMFLSMHAWYTPVPASGIAA